MGSPRDWRRAARSRQKRSHVFFPAKPPIPLPPPCSEISREVRAARTERAQAAKRIAKVRFLSFLDEKEDLLDD